jgi:uncharacterized protein YjbJ (UPF0337 family)
MGKHMNKAKGRIKQAVGDLAGDKNLRREGVVDEVKGNAEDAAENAGRAVTEAGRAIKNVTK